MTGQSDLSINQDIHDFGSNDNLSSIFSYKMIRTFTIDDTTIKSFDGTSLRNRSANKYKCTEYRPTHVEAMRHWTVNDSVMRGSC